VSAAQRRIVTDVLAELQEATVKFGPFASAHEGYAVILEELDELWVEVRTKTGTRESQYAEAKQVAAMAMRFMLDVCASACNRGEG
jgi:hypothetical protein